MSVDVVTPQTPGLEDPFNKEKLDGKSEEPKDATVVEAVPAAKPTKPKKAKKAKPQSDEEDEILNFDPVADLNDLDAEEVTKGVGSQENLIHIRIQQRNGRKSLTTIQGLPKKFDPKKILKFIKKEFACNGVVVDDEKFGSVIQLQGDQRPKIKEFLTTQGICKETEIKVHGF